MTGSPALITEVEWWRKATIYQIYPRSFNDSNGDGWGDLNGIRERISYLSALGIDAVWLSPFYESPGADAGYDVADYLAIDPTAGSPDDFDMLISELHDNGIKMIIDIVPNHCSSEHRLFIEALAAGPASSERKLFHFRDGKGANGELPPNNWQSHFGGPAWTRVINSAGEPEQWYLHLFDTRQPDFNWDNPQVEAHFHMVLQFWLDRGVDGFRVDVAHLLIKDPDLPDWDGPPNGAQHPNHPTQDSPMFGKDGVHEIFRRWRSLLDKVSAETGSERALCGEVCVLPLSWQSLWARPDEMHTIFNFSLLNIPFEAASWRTTIEESLNAYAEVQAPTTWVLNNHDVARIVTRLGYKSGYPKIGDGIGPNDPQPDPALGLRRARAAVTSLMTLPGSIYIYQGEELGLPDHSTIPLESRQDPTYFRSNGARVGRDGSRAPIPWKHSGSNFGFSSADKTWLPQPDVYDIYAADLQENDEESTLALYKKLIETRKNLDVAMERIDLPSTALGDQLLIIEGNTVMSIMNTSDDIVDINHLVSNKELILESEPTALIDGRLAPATAVWLRKAY